MIKAEIIADSKNPGGDRITTMIVTFPRFILAELNTHRMFSRNSASSRAIPFRKMVESVKTNPFVPIAWQKDHPGMQGTEYIINKEHIDSCITVWLQGRDHAVHCAERLNWDLGKDFFPPVTKQLCNRLLEPFMWHTIIITATDWNNFFSLRCPRYKVDGEIFRSKKDALVKLEATIGESDFNDTDDYMQWATINDGQAEIHMMALAEAMWDSYNESTPRELEVGEWHIPFGDRHTADDPAYGPLVGVKIATARCARVSYTVVGEEGKSTNYENDIKLHDRLSKSGHMSPFEHCAKAMDNSNYSGNFRGFEQYRKMFALENLL